MKTVIKKFTVKVSRVVPVVGGVAFFLLLVSMLLPLVVSAQTIDPDGLEPNCATVNQGFQLTIKGDGFKVGTDDVQVEALLSDGTSLATFTTTAVDVNTIVVDVPANSAMIGAARSIGIVVKNRNGEGASSQYKNVSNQVAFIVYEPVGTVGAISGPTSVCQGEQAVYSVEAVHGATSYTWALPTGATIEGASTSNTITVNYGDNSTSGQVTVWANNGCGVQSEPVNLDVHVKKTVTLTGGSIAVDTDHPENEVEVGEPATFTASSEIIQLNDVGSYRWYSTEDGVSWSPLPNSNTQSYTVASVPSDLFAMKVEITPRSVNACYTNLPRTGYLTIESEPVTPLPVEIIYFSAAKQGKDVLLAWATAMEKDNTGFEVQVSEDGLSFRRLGFVGTQNGNTVLRQEYRYTDRENGKHGTRYYRLKQVDTDGGFEYFTTKAVSFGQVSGYSLKAYPNPFESEVNFSITAEQPGQLHVQVFDMLGKPIKATSYDIAMGSSEKNITLAAALPTGMYLVKTNMNGNIKSFKLLKK
ncbi:T9SS type A sorting domain-containing protein [Pontibacter korlensis]|uniref:Uncharacterized protein n=1 Tax=Pontibacter korlensis TaxID=400092 RepID=A0A0E3ZGN8_9BACT|nr:T9SS type A sorting domain-containing protein [Pontibacter korlensis]AKD03548.1 hypothetical protein PKOR_10910 [Pontibacter korlensis]